MKKALLILAFAALCVSCGNRNTTEEIAVPAADSTKACCDDTTHTHADSTKACCDSTKVK